MFTKWGGTSNQQALHRGSNVYYNKVLKIFALKDLFK